MRNAFSFIAGILVIALISGATYFYFGKKEARAPTIKDLPIENTASTEISEIIENEENATSTSATTTNTSSVNGEINASTTNQTDSN